MAKGFQGFPGGANLQGLMQQAQKMKQQLEKVQSEIETFEADGSAGGGAVKVRVNGKGEILSIKIDPQIVDPKDVSMLEDTLTAACNDALTKARSNREEKMGSVTGGMNIPGL